MEQHKVISLAMGKPLVLEELGKRVTANLTAATLQSSILSVREPFMEMVYGQFNQSLQTGDIWRGEPCLARLHNLRSPSILLRIVDEL
jgi:hypothetical protein